MSDGSTVRRVTLSFFVMYFSQGISQIAFSISRGLDTINVLMRIRTLSTGEFHYKYSPMIREQHIMRQNCSLSTTNDFIIRFHTLQFHSSTIITIYTGRTVTHLQLLQLILQ